MDDLNRYRGRLDELDAELLRLFAERMEIAARIGEWKKERQLPVLDARREQEKLSALRAQCPEELQEDAVRLFSLILELSRGRQERILRQESGGTRDEARP